MRLLRILTRRLVRGGIGVLAAALTLKAMACWGCTTSPGVGEAPASNHPELPSSQSIRSNQVCRRRRRGGFRPESMKCSLMAWARTLCR